MRCVDEEAINQRKAWAVQWLEGLCVAQGATVVLKEAFSPGELARQVHEHEARVRQPRQRIGQRVFLRLLEHDRVVDDGRRLLRDALEQAAMVVGVEVRRRRDRRPACR